MDIEVALMIAAAHFRVWFAEDYDDMDSWPDHKVLAMLTDAVEQETVDDYPQDFSDEQREAYEIVFDVDKRTGRDFLLHVAYTPGELREAAAAVAANERELDREEHGSPTLGHLSDAELVQVMVESNTMDAIDAVGMDWDVAHNYLVLIAARERGINVLDYIG